MNFLIKLFLNAFAVMVVAYLLRDGVHVTSFGYAVVLAALLAILNASVKPILIVLTLPATIFTLGLFLLFINTFIILIADWIIKDGFRVDGFWWAFLFSILLSIVNSIFERLVLNKSNISISVNKKEPDTKIFDKDGNRIV